MSGITSVGGSFVFSACSKCWPGDSREEPIKVLFLGLVLSPLTQKFYLLPIIPKVTSIKCFLFLFLFLFFSAAI